MATAETSARTARSVRSRNVVGAAGAAEGLDTVAICLWYTNPRMVLSSEYGV
jgi:hypothetical protein